MAGKNEKLCFVLMPFKEELQPVYDQAIKPACAEAEFRALRVDELQGTFNINRKIIEHIFSSHAIIADLTDWNPNVFYEMGVAHALDNKTIMIIQKKDRLPFDVSTYRCIIYEQTEAGLSKLQKEIIASLQHLEQWRCHPSNPVQDFKPADTLVPKSEMERLQLEWQMREEGLLKTTVAKTEWEKLQRELHAKEQLLNDTVAKSDWETAQQQLQAKTAELVKLQKQLELVQAQAAATAQPARVKLAGPIELRAQPVGNLSAEQVKKMLKAKDLFDSDYNKAGKGLHLQYELKEQDGEKLVLDSLTGLTWQQSGSSNYMDYANAKEHIDELNAKQFAGYNDWRLPTMEEAMSLMEPKKHDELFLDSVFDRKQRWIWTADQTGASSAWVVFFYGGLCIHGDVFNYDLLYVRAVRRGQSII